ncbi:unnamed protein product [Discosporangium mesarthrocarpum]
MQGPKDPRAVHLMRLFRALEVVSGWWHRALHISGASDVLADGISRWKSERIPKNLEGLLILLLVPRGQETPRRTSWAEVHLGQDYFLCVGGQLARGGLAAGSHQLCTGHFAAWSRFRHTLKKRRRL